MSDRSRLRWRCCRRGTREMDTLLGRFLEQEYDQLDTTQQALFEKFLDEADPDIYAWVLGYTTLPDAEYQQIIQRLQKINIHTA